MNQCTVLNARQIIERGVRKWLVFVLVIFVTIGCLFIGLRFWDQTNYALPNSLRNRYEFAGIRIHDSVNRLRNEKKKREKRTRLARFPLSENTLYFLEAPKSGGLWKSHLKLDKKGVVFHLDHEWDSENPSVERNSLEGLVWLSRVKPLGIKVNYADGRSERWDVVTVRESPFQISSQPHLHLRHLDGREFEVWVQHPVGQNSGS